MEILELRLPDDVRLGRGCLSRRALAESTGSSVLYSRGRLSASQTNAALLRGVAPETSPQEQVRGGRVLPLALRDLQPFRLLRHGPPQPRT